MLVNAILCTIVAKPENAISGFRATDLIVYNLGAIPVSGYIGWKITRFQKGRDLRFNAGSWVAGKNSILMGSPLSPIVANIFMDAFEGTAIESAQLKPKVWFRYMDDTFITNALQSFTIISPVNTLTFSLPWKWKPTIVFLFLTLW